METVSVLNYSHPFTQAQLEQIKKKFVYDIVLKVQETHVQIDYSSSVLCQILDLCKPFDEISVGNPTRTILVNLPSLAISAGILATELKIAAQKYDNEIGLIIIVPEGDGIFRQYKIEEIYWL